MGKNLKFKAGDIAKGNLKWLVVNIEDGYYNVYCLVTPSFSKLWTFSIVYLDAHNRKL